LFRATIGGLGLTGIILSAEICLKPVQGGLIDVEFLPFETLDTFAELTDSSDAGWEYTVAWVDLLRAERERLPGIFMRGNHAPAPGTPVKPPRALARWPFEMPFSPFNRITCGAFNRLYHWRQKLRKAPFRQSYGAFFHPLDVIDDWNKLYGPKGFFQYQCVVPKAAGLEPFRDIFAALRQAGAVVPLAVMKQTGAMEPAGLLSFPVPGWTLAMDLPNRGDATMALFGQLDGIVRPVGGRLYPAKDAVMSAGFFQSSYPEWSRLEALRDPAIGSDFWKRVTSGNP
jgi:FAD/FMN-containing dehydrogenase